MFQGKPDPKEGVPRVSDSVHLQGHPAVAFPLADRLQLMGDKSKIPFRRTPGRMPLTILTGSKVTGIINGDGGDMDGVVVVGHHNAAVALR